MIYTVTFNPALDYTAWVPDFKAGALNRTARERIYPGGKGINVSVVLKNLGYDNRALGFIAGFTGREISSLVAESGCTADFIELPDGFSRINVKIRSSNETELNGHGPVIDENSVNELYKQLDLLKDGDILILAGSIPDTLPEDMYERILIRLDTRRVLAVVDATNGLLRRILPCRPFLIKPNRAELCELFGVSYLEEDRILRCAEKLHESGARNVLVSLGQDGAILLSENGTVHKISAPLGRVINSVGAGDSMVAGFIAGYLKSHDYSEALKLGVAAGSATAFCEWLATNEEIMKVYNTL